MALRMEELSAPPVVILFLKPGNLKYKSLKDLSSVETKPSRVCGGFFIVAVSSIATVGTEGDTSWAVWDAAGNR